MSLAIKRVPADGPLIESVLLLYSQNSRTLGFLPRGAFAEFANEGRVLAACDDRDVIGYIAWRRPGEEAVIVHLCVAAAHRGKGVASTLMKAFLAEVEDASAVRLTCRQDWKARDIWPKFGFVIVGERPGRGQDGGKLQIWRREQSRKTDLFDYVQQQIRSERLTVVLDAVVFFDFAEETTTAAESKALLADWLVNEIALFATGELRNEIGRNSDANARRDGERRLAELDGLLIGDPAEVQRITTELLELLPREQEDCDRRQLAHAIAERADYFATRDTRILTIADQIHQRYGLQVVRPCDLIVRLHAEADASSYVPERLGGTQILRRPPKSETDLLRFQRYAQAESCAQWFTRTRAVLANPHIYHTRLVYTPDSPPTAAYSVNYCEDETARIVILRAVRDQLSGTLLRRLLADLINDAAARGKKYLTCEDTTDTETAAALRDLGFVLGRSGYERALVTGIMSEQIARAILSSSPVGQEISSVCRSPFELERVCWPVKIVGADIPSFIVPIRPGWASQLFDVALAEADLFGAPTSLALALENVYYSASNINIPYGARILWYVSGGRGEIRACSRCIETDVGTPKDLYRRYRRLGIYRWEELMASTKGELDRKLRAYRFAATECFRTAIPLEQARSIMNQHRDATGHPFVSPFRIREATFVSIYRAGVLDA